MNFLKRFFSSKKERPIPIRSNEDFWNWFAEQADNFHEVVRSHGDIEGIFFNKLEPKLAALKQGYFYLTGMLDDDTVELILTPDGKISNIVFVEELVAAAPNLPGWKFTALKPSIDVNVLSINMGPFEFRTDNMQFFVNEHIGYPDEIDLTIIHKQFSKGQENEITNGVYIFLDNYLGELKSIETIDNLVVAGPEAGNGKELIPIEKLESYLAWRQKEFVEKHEDIWYRMDTEQDAYSALEGAFPNGQTTIAIVNSNLLNWDGKASHPWMLWVKFTYDGSDNNGMPSTDTHHSLKQFEDDLINKLPDQDGYLNIGRETGGDQKILYMACKDYRLPSKVMNHILDNYKGQLDIEFDIYKDKYWRSVDQFNPDH